MLGDNRAWAQSGTQGGWGAGPAAQQQQTGWSAASQTPQQPLTGWNQPTQPPSNLNGGWGASTSAAQQPQQQQQQQQPRPQANGWGSSNPAQPAVNGWNSSAANSNVVAATQPLPSFSKHYDPREDTWSPSSFTGTRNRASSWGVSQAIQPSLDFWDQVPGYPSRANKDLPSWGAPPVRQESQLPPASSGNWQPPDHILQRSQQWANPPAPVSAHTANHPGWAPSGWDPLPPPNLENSQKWDGIRPEPVAPSLPQAPPVSDNLAVVNNLAVANNLAALASKTAVKFDDVQPVSEKLPPDSYAQAVSIGESFKQQQLRKVRSTPGLDRKFQTGSHPHPTGQRNVGANGMWKKDFKVDSSKENLNEDSKKLNGATMDSRLKDPTKACGVYIYGFPKWVQVSDIISVFSRYGTIINVGIVGKTKTHERLYAYVDYEVDGSAAKAVDGLMKQNVFEMGKPLELKLHFDKRVLEDDEAVPAPLSSSQPPAALAHSPAAAAIKKDSLVKKDSKEFKSAKGDEKKDKTDEKDVDTRTLHVGNLPQTVDKSGVEKVFAVYGQIKRIHVVQRPKEKRAFAFVSFRDESSAKKALAAIKVNKFFDMTENLRAEYSKLQHVEKKQTGTASTSGIDKPWKKGEALKQLESMDKKKEDKKDKKKSATPPPQPKKELPLVVFIAHAGTLQSDEIVAKFSEYGPLKSHYIVPRIAAPLQPPPESHPSTEEGSASDHPPVDNSGTKSFAVVVFENTDDAAKATAVKPFGGVFPRQRRVIVRDFPPSTTEEEIKEWFATMGDIRKMEIYTESASATASGKEEKWWLVEYMRAEAAAKLLVKCVEEKFLDTKVHGEYAPSARVPKKGRTTDEKEAEKKEEEEEAQVAKEADAMDEAKAAAAAAEAEAAAAEESHVEGKDEHHEFEASDDEKELIKAELAALEGQKTAESLPVAGEEHKE